MRPLISCAIVLLVFASACDAACFLKPLVITDFFSLPKGCTDADGELHDFMAEWKKNCHECVCFHHGTICCETILPRKVHSPECEVVVDREKCTSKAVLRSDPTKECV